MGIKGAKSPTKKKEGIRNYSDYVLYKGKVMDITDYEDLIEGNRKDAPKKKKDITYIECLNNYKRVDNKYRQINYLIASNTYRDLFNAIDLKRMVECYIPKRQLQNLYANYLKAKFAKTPKRKKRLI